MEKTNNSSSDIESEIQELIQTLPRETNWDGAKLCLYQGYWCHEPGLKGVVLSQRLFQAHDTDILLATLPKAGTTWLKALGYTILNRNKRLDDGSIPSINVLPHALMPSLEYGLYGKTANPDLSAIPTPRLFSTHMQASILPKSVWDSKCKIIYICRNPLDLFVSYWHFWLKSMPEEAKACGMDEALNTFLKGVQYHGPFYDHILGYWNASLKYKDPKKVLILKYEDLKQDTNKYIKEIAEFMGLPFTEEEEKQGRVEEIAKVCSFDSLKNLEVNKTGQFYPFIKNDAFFRKGQVGDWANHLTPSMVEKIIKVMEEKFDGTGLTF